MRIWPGLRYSRLAASRSSDGSTKAAVLPVPVWAMPNRSRPVRTVGMAWRWIGVGTIIFGVRERIENGLREPESLKSQKYYLERMPAATATNRGRQRRGNKHPA